MAENTGEQILVHFLHVSVVNSFHLKELVKIIFLGACRSILVLNVPCSFLHTWICAAQVVYFYVLHVCDWIYENRP